MPLCDESAQTDCAYLETRGLGGWRGGMGQTRSRFFSVQNLRLAFIVDFRINETLQIGAVANRTYRGESVHLFINFNASC